MSLVTNAGVAFNTSKIGNHDLFIFITLVLCQSNFQNVCRRTMCKPTSSVKFENENDFTPSGINMNRACFPIF